MQVGFLEIGTSDFDTLAEKIDPLEDSHNFSVEPMKCYLDRLPDKKNVTKVNCAISDRNGTDKLWFISEEDIIKHQLHFGFRGCNSIGQKHPTNMKYLEEHKLGDLMQSVDIDIVNINDFLRKYNIVSINLLKIDTEGHDCVILRELLNKGTLQPKTIIFESNSLTPHRQVKEIVGLLKSKGYYIYYHGNDTMASKTAPATFIGFSEVNTEANKNEVKEFKNNPYDETTVVTCLYDLSLREPRSRSGADYLKLSAPVLQLDFPMVIYTDVGYLSKIKELRKNFLHKTVIIEQPYENLDFYEQYYNEIMEYYGKTFPQSYYTDRRKHTPAYNLVTLSKFTILRQALQYNYFNSSQFAWLDLGIYHLPTTVSPLHMTETLLRKFTKVVIGRQGYEKDSFHYGFTAGFFAADQVHMSKLVAEFYQQVAVMIDRKQIQYEEYILGNVAESQPEIFEEFYGSFRDATSARIDIRRVIPIMVESRSKNNFTKCCYMGSKCLDYIMNAEDSDITKFLDEYALALYYLQDFTVEYRQVVKLLEQSTNLDEQQKRNLEFYRQKVPSITE